MYNQHKKTKPIKVVGILCGFIAILVFVLAIFIFIISIMKNSGAYEVSINKIEQMPEVYEQIGEIQGYGFMPSGSINTTNGSGEATLTIKVKGEYGNLHVTLYSIKTFGGNWVVQNYKIE